MDYLYQVEENDGLRFSWNIWPRSPGECQKLGVPISCMFTPLKNGNNVPTVYYEPLMCKGPCRTYLNSYCHVDFVAKCWACPFCGQRNQFPPQYGGMSDMNLTAELTPEVTSIQYVLPPSFFSKNPEMGGNPPKVPPVFLFVLDVCVDQEELQALKDAVLRTLDIIPRECYVALMTFGSKVQIFSLKSLPCTVSYIFRGTCDVSVSKVQKILGLGMPGQGGVVRPSPVCDFIMPLEHCELNIQMILEQQLNVDPCPVKNDRRSLRSTGVAMSVAISLMEYTFTGTGGRIMLFMGGPCTQGPGMIVSDALTEPIRSHHELKKETAKRVVSASDFYSGLAARVAHNGHAVDMYSCSFDQTGLLEMQSLSKNTGGVIVLADSFQSEVFRQSLSKVFETTTMPNAKMNMALNATIEVITCPELNICGAIGHLVPMNKKKSYQNHISNNVIGIGKTNVWKCCALDPNCNFAFYFEVASNSGGGIIGNIAGAVHNNSSMIALPSNVQQKANAMIQFVTMYQDTLGNQIMKVTTSAHPWASQDVPLRSLVRGFDQEAATALVARMAVFKSEHENANSIRWLDRQLIMLLYRFSDFCKGDPMSLEIPMEMSMFHQFMFYLRRGPLIQVFNNSPDETVFFRFYLHRENTSNVLVMIQPTLDSYVLDAPSQPVMLSTTSITPNNVLLLDTYFHIVIHYGSTIAQWRALGYHRNPEYGNLLELLELPKAEAADLIASRMPMPIYVECDQGTSQARFLMASVDPAITHKSDQYYQSNGNNNSQMEFGQVVLSEDVNLQVFGTALKKRIVEFNE